MRKTTTCLLAICGMVIQTQLLATIIYVDDNAAGPTYNGTSWSNAYTSLQDGLSDASAGDTIAVASGTYNPHASLRTTYFNLKEGVVMLGSFEGSEIIDSTNIANRDFENNSSILSADLNGNDNGFTNNDENAYHVLYARATSSSITSATVIDGFEITGGNANVNGGTNYEYMRGGGIYLEATMPYAVSPTFRNINVHTNNAQQGGGIFISSLTSATCSPTFENFAVDNNQASETTGTQLTASGGIDISTAEGTSNPTFTSGSISLNNVTSPSGVGGGVSISAIEVAGNAYCSPTFTNVYFCKNYAAGGGSYVVTGAENDGSQVQPVFINVTMAGSANSTVFYNSVNGSETSVCNPELINCIINTTYPITMFNLGNGMSTPNPQISYSNIKNSGGSSSWISGYGTDGGNNMDELPLFKDTSNCDLRLYNGSAELGAGDGSNGDNIGWYQGTGLIYLDVDDIANYESCNGDTLFTFKFKLDDEAQDNAEYNIALGTGALEMGNITHNFTNDSLRIEIRVADTLSGSDTLTVYYSNDENEADTTDFIFTLAARPTIPIVGYGLFNYSDSTYVIHLNNNWSATGLRNVLNGNVVTDQYFTGLEPGVYHAQLEEDGCYSDTATFELVPYLNEVDLEISNVGDTTDFYLCDGDDGTMRVECTIKDDYPELAELSYRGDFNDLIPEENITVSETDTSYVFEVMVPDNVGSYRLSLHVEDIYMNMANLYYNFNRGNIPNIDSVMVQESGPDYFCINVDISGAEYSYLTQVYLDDAQLTGDWASICGIETGAHTVQAVYDGCESNIYPFSVTSGYTGRRSLIDKNISRITIYPIPANNAFTIVGVKDSGYISIYSMDGELLEQGSLSNGQPFDISCIPSGTYILTFTNDTQIIQRKLVVSR